MSVKNAIGTSLLVVGLLISIVGWTKRSPEAISTEIQGKEVMIRNSDNYNLNWRAFFGLTFAGLGVGLLGFPANKDIDAEKFD